MILNKFFQNYALAVFINATYFWKRLKRRQSREILSICPICLPLQNNSSSLFNQAQIPSRFGEVSLYIDNKKQPALIASYKKAISFVKTTLKEGLHFFRRNRFWKNNSCLCISKRTNFRKTGSLFFLLNFQNY